MADTYFVSQLGTSAAGAVGVVFSLMALIQAVGFMLGMGAGSLTSRLLGQKKQEEAAVVVSTAFFTALAFGLCMTVGGMLAMDGLLRLLGSTETTFYTIAVYFGAAGIVKTRYAVPAALCADLAGFMAAAWAVRVLFE